MDRQIIHLETTDFRYHSIDLWRGFACLWIVILHSNCYLRKEEEHNGPVSAGIASVANVVYNYGWIGVPMFFVISGYCIAASAAKAANNGSRPSQFFWRRFIRIFPPYWICLAGSVLILIAGEWIFPTMFVEPVRKFNFPWDIPWRNWLGTITLTETWLGQALNYPFAWEYFFLGQAWSLCYEEQFYLLSGLCLLCLRKRLAAGFTVITAMVLARCVYLEPNLNSGFFFDGRWLYFASGLAAFYAIHSRSKLSRWMCYAYLAFGLFWSGWQPLTLLNSFHSIPLERFVCFGFGALLIALYRFDKSISSIAILQPLQFCGVMCYSIYLTHWTFVKPMSRMMAYFQRDSVIETALITTPLCVAVSLLVGYLFHIGVERHFLPSKKATIKREPMVQNLVEEGTYQKLAA